MIENIDNLPPVALWSAEELPLGILLGKTAFHMQKTFTDRVHLTGKEFGFLRLIDLHDGISQSGIERITRWDGAVVTRLAKKLESEGLVRRVPNPADNRFTNVFLTEEGRRKLVEIHPMLAALNHAAFAGISEEDLVTVRRALEQIQRNIADLRCHD